MVAVVVTHDPGPWFEGALGSLVAQDYPNLSLLVIDAASDVDPTRRVARVSPDVYVRRLGANPGFGSAANRALGMVEGASFYLLCHDDVVLDPTGVRQLVEEAYRANAGIVGPKVLRWDDPTRLLQVGLGSDKFGVPSAIAERNELDQAQHDGGRDVFAVPGGCVLIRADLFRELGGFDDQMSFHGEDLDLCWRAQLAGARVAVAPMARARHLEALGERRPDDRRRLQSRHRLRMVLGNYGLFYLLAILPQQLALSLVEILVSVVTGRGRNIADVVGAYLWNARHLPSLLRKRRRNRRLRQVTDLQIRRMQVRGSARATTFIRKQWSGDRGEGGAARSRRQVFSSMRSSRVQQNAVMVALVVCVVAFGSRHLLTQRLPVVGELASLPSSGRDLLSEWLSGWRAVGLGAQASPPTGLALLGLVEVVLLGRAELVRSVLFVGLLPLGGLGMWRLLSAASDRSRAAVAGLVAYLANPLAYGAIAAGSWRGLAVYAACPWLLRRLVVTAGVAPFAPPASEPRRPAWSATIGLGVVTGLATMAYPAAPLLVVGLAATLVLGGLLAGSREGALRFLAVGFGAAAIGTALHFPWLVGGLDNNDPDLSLGGRLGGEGGYSLADALHFAVGPAIRSPLTWGVFVAALLPLAIGRGWRLAWAVRAWALAAVPWLVVALTRAEILEVRLPPPEVLLSPAAVGLALAVGMGVLAFERDLPGYGFGWRQLASVIAGAALLAAALPLAVASFDGRWHQPRGGYDRALRFQADEADELGEFRVLWLGDPAVLPTGSWRLPAEVARGAYATTEGIPTARHVWTGPQTGTTELVPEALAAAVRGDTNRLGRLLAPMGVRYLIVPSQLAPAPFGGPTAEPDPALGDVLADQLDLVEVDLNPAMAVYRNASWAPTVVDDAALASVGVAGPPPAPALRASGPLAYEGEVRAGTVLRLAQAASPQWRLGVEGGEQPLDDEPDWANRFTVEASGAASLGYTATGARLGFAGLQVLVWAAALFLAVRRPEAILPIRRRGRATDAPGPGVVVVTGPLTLPPDSGPTPTPGSAATRTLADGPEAGAGGGPTVAAAAPGGRDPADGAVGGGGVAPLDDDRPEEAGPGPDGDVGAGEEEGAGAASSPPAGQGPAPDPAAAWAVEEPAWLDEPPTAPERGAGAGEHDGDGDRPVAPAERSPVPPDPAEGQR